VVTQEITKNEIRLVCRPAKVKDFRRWWRKKKYPMTRIVEAAQMIKHEFMERFGVEADVQINVYDHKNGQRVTRELAHYIADQFSDTLGDKWEWNTEISGGVSINGIGGAFTKVAGLSVYYPAEQHPEAVKELKRGSNR